jgi:hypothetical protein
MIQAAASRFVAKLYVVWDWVKVGVGLISVSPLLFLKTYKHLERETFLW